MTAGPITADPMLGSAALPIRWFRPRDDSTKRPDSLAEIGRDAAASTRLLILQPTPFCNIDCDYCYLPDRDATQRMSMDTLRLAVQRLRDDGLAGAELTLVWHAGEPLAVPIDFYRQAFELVGQVLGPVSRVTHALQTNATLIDPSWCELFKQHAVRVGVSIDGPAELHDRHRRTRSGKGTHARVMQGLQQLRMRGIAFHAIAVVTRDTLAHADAFFDFFLDNGIHDLGCNFDEAEGGHARSSLVGCEAAHASFLERLLQRSIASGGRVVVRELASAWQLVARPLPQYAWHGRRWPDNAQVMPLALIAVAWNGDFCTFSPELLGQRSTEFGDFVLGSVADGGYRERLQAPTLRRLWSAVRAGVEACDRQCAYFAFCGGGAPANKWFENGDLASTETLYCRSMIQRPFDAVLGRLERDRAAGLPAVGAQAASAGEEMA
jgi:uncharacterized protein